MNIEIKGVHFDVGDKIREYINKKIRRIEFAKDFIVDLLFTLTAENNQYKLEVTINFRWGTSSHIKVENHHVYDGLNILFDKMENKIRKEKEKIQEHKA